MDRLDRRGFLSTSLMALTAVDVLPSLLGGTAPPTSPSARTSSARSTFSAERFRQALGSRFTIQRDGTPQSVTLTDVREGPKSPGLEQFTAVFACQRTDAVVPGLYQVHHAELGRFDLRLERSGGVAGCSAVFNLLV